MSGGDPTPVLMPRARAQDDPDLVMRLPVARSYAERVSFCADVLARGLWAGRPVVQWLCGAWNVREDTVSAYRRAAAASNQRDRGEQPEQLEDVLGAFRRQEEDFERTAERLEVPRSTPCKKCKGAECPRCNGSGQVTVPPEPKDVANAAKYRLLAQRARERQAQITGILQAKVSVSLEGDPRLAGFFPALWEALAEIDAARGRYIEEVERLTGGPLPIAELPCAVETVKDAIVAYEARTGGRAALGVGG